MSSLDPDSNRESFAAQLGKQQILTSLRYFAIFTVAGLAVLLYATYTPDTLAALSHLDGRFFALAAALQVVNITLGARRNHILANRVRQGVSFRLCVRAQLASDFGAAASPGQSGGGPAWLFIMYRGGLPLASGIAVSVLIWLSTLAFFLLATSAAIYTLSGRYPQEGPFALLPYGFVACAGLFIGVLLTLWHPERIERLLFRLASFLQRFSKAWITRLAALADRGAAAIHKFEANSMLLIRQHPLTVLHAASVTALYYLGRWNLAYLLMLGLGVEVDYVTAIAICILMRFSLAFMPTPGGGGIGDIAIATLLSPVMPNYLLPVYVVLYRSFHFFLPGALGGWVIISTLRAGGRSDRHVLQNVDSTVGA